MPRSLHTDDDDLTLWQTVLVVVLLLAAVAAFGAAACELWTGADLPARKSLTRAGLAPGAE